MAASRSGPDLRVIVFSGAAPIEPYRLLDRIERDVPGAQVAGVLYVHSGRKTLTATSYSAWGRARPGRRLTRADSYGAFATPKASWRHFQKAFGAEGI